MAINVFDQYGIKEVADIVFYKVSASNPNHKKPVLYIDTAKVSTIETTAENVEATGGRGNVAQVSWDFNKEITITIEDALMSIESLMATYGAKEAIQSSSSTPIERDIPSEVVTTDGTGNLTLAYPPIAETIYIYPAKLGRMATGQQLHDVTITGNQVSGAELTANTEYVVYYKTEVTDGSGVEININSDDFPGTYQVVMHTVMRSKINGMDDLLQITIYQAKMSAENTLTLEAEGDPATFDLSLRVLRDPASRKMLTIRAFQTDEQSGAEGDLAPSDLSATSGVALDLSALQSTVDVADLLTVPGPYTSGVAAFQTALQNAKDIIAGTFTGTGTGGAITQADVNSADTALKAGISGLS